MQRLRISQRFGNKKINMLTRRDVQQWLNELRESGLAPSTCDHHGKLIRQALNLAVQWELLDSNPVAGVKLFGTDNRVANVMTDDQLQQLMSTFNNPSDGRKVASLAVKYLLFTGARVNEALNARWQDIDRGNRTWSILATNSKCLRRRAIPINDAAMAVLDQLDTEGDPEWLFVSCYDDGKQRQ